MANNIRKPYLGRLWELNDATLYTLLRRDGEAPRVTVLREPMALICVAATIPRLRIAPYVVHLKAPNSTASSEFFEHRGVILANKVVVGLILGRRNFFVLNAH